MNEGDLDSFVGNDVASEDDQMGVCTSAPIALLCREIKKIGIDSEFASYQWYKDGVAIPGETLDSLELTESGSYEVLVDGGLCPYGNCCPFVVTEEPCANLGNLVWEDLDGDGIQDVGETGIENVTVYLYDVTTGLAIDSALTDASGSYLFEELATNDYYLIFDISTNTSGVEFAPTAQNSGGDDTTDSDANTSGQTANINFDASTGDDLTIDAGFVPIADIGDFVWVDANQDGLQSFGEAVVPGVEDIPYGDYNIDFDLSTATGFEDYGFTTMGAGDGTNDSEVDLNGQGPDFSFDPRTGDDLTHDAGIFPVSSIGDTVWVDLDGDGTQNESGTGLENVTVILYDANTGTPLDTVLTDANGNYLFTDVPSGDYTIGFDYSTSPGAQDFTWSTIDSGGDDTMDSDVNTNGQTNTFTFDASAGDDLTIDAGLVPVANIGDFVWVDTNMDGIQNPSESGLENVTVILYDNGGVPIDTAYTDSNGAYLFEDYPVGNYSIVFDPSTNINGYDYSFSDDGTGNGANDSDADPSTGATTTFAFDPTTGDDLTWDAGVFPTANIGNYVWNDVDGDGIQDPSETGVENVMVVLYDAGSGVALDTVFTNASGGYLFTEVPQGNYYLGFDPSTNASGVNYDFSNNNTGNGSNDSDADPGSGFTGIINFDPTTGDDLTWDAGLTPIAPTANIGDELWVDTNGDGIQGPTEPGVENVTVILYDSNTGLPIDSVFTDANGNYLFENVLSGDYYIVFDPSTSALGADYVFTTAGVGADSEADSDADGTGTTSIFTFDATAGDKLDCDAGIIPVPSIGNVKSTLSTTTLPDGNLEIAFEIGVKNTGLVDLTNISLIDNLSAELGASYVGMSAAVPNMSILASTATTPPALNAGFNGMGNNDIFAGAPTDLLEPDQEVKVMILVVVNPTLATWPLQNQSMAFGDGLDENGTILEDGMGGALTVNDPSDSGADYEGDNPDEPGDQGTTDDPTAITCTDANPIITGEPATLCPGEDVILSVSSTLQGATYEWRELGSTTVLATSSTATFTNIMADTDYEVTVINNSAVCAYGLVTTTTIAVSNGPVVNPTANYMLNPDCTPSDLSLTAFDVAGDAAIVSYDWTGPGGWTSSIQNPTIPDATSAYNGAYTLVVTDASGCTAAGNVEVTTIEDEVAQPIIATSGPACEGESITLSIPTYSGGGVTYTWTIPGDASNVTGQGTNEIIIFPADAADDPGTYSVSVDVDGCVLTADYNVVVYGPPAPVVDAVVADSCEGGSFELTATAISGAT